MAYGEGGKSTGYGTSTAGTGGYAKNTKCSETEFPNYDYYEDIDIYFGFRE